jgi:hypothetical protein
MMLTHGIGWKDARAVKKKYYLMEEGRNERLTEGGDFFEAGAAHPCSFLFRMPVTLHEVYKCYYLNK